MKLSERGGEHRKNCTEINKSVWQIASYLHMKPRNIKFDEKKEEIIFSLVHSTEILRNFEMNESVYVSN